MKGFFIKKAFFDGWDNLIPMVLLNLIYIALFLASIAVLQLTDVMYLLLALIVLIGNILMGGVANAAYNWSDYKSNTFSSFKEGIGRNIKHSLLYFVLQLLQFVLITIVFPFYMAAGGVISVIITVILFWVELVLLLALPFYFPLMSRLPGDRPLKTLKKCFIILLDNFGFSLFFGIYNLICVVLTIATMGLIPGIAGLQLAKQDAIKLLMMKYDYIEEEGDDADRRHIPWGELLIEEREKLGPRSLKDMLFPWK